MNLEDAIACLKANGYKVSKLRQPTVAQRVHGLHLNAVGKSYGANYDPNYRMKYKTPRLSSKQGVDYAVQRQLYKAAIKRRYPDNPEMVEEICRRNGVVN